jgi:hypothetical protein
MKSTATLLILVLMMLSNSLFAQEELKDSLKTIVVKTYRGNEQLKSLKISQYDTNQIMIQQDRWDYIKVDTGRWAKRHYYYTYNPNTRLGEFYTEHHQKDGSSTKKHLHKFKSFRHRLKDKAWIKLYGEDGKVLRETQNSFDQNGFLTKVYTKDYSYKPTLIHTEAVQRNDLGLMLKWESYDEDGDGKKKVREMNWSYKEDSILVESSGYVFNNWKETINEFDKKTGLIKKQTQTYGYRQDDGTIIRNHKNISQYKDEQKIKMIEYEHKKKFATHRFEYEGDSEIQRIDYKDKKMADEVYLFKTVKDSLGRSLLYEESLNDALKEKIVYSYSSEGTLTKKEDYEYRKNGTVSLQITEYNSDGRILRQALKVDDRLLKEDRYEYTFHEAKLEEQAKD